MLLGAHQGVAVLGGVRGKGYDGPLVFVDERVARKRGVAGHYGADEARPTPGTTMVGVQVRKVALILLIHTFPHENGNDFHVQVTRPR